MVLVNGGYLDGTDIKKKKIVNSSLKSTKKEKNWLG